MEFEIKKVLICALVWFPVINQQIKKRFEKEKKALSRYNYVYKTQNFDQ